MLRRIVAACIITCLICCGVSAAASLCFRAELEYRSRLAQVAARSLHDLAAARVEELCRTQLEVYGAPPSGEELASVFSDTYTLFDTSGNVICLGGITDLSSVQADASAKNSAETPDSRESAISSDDFPYSLLPDGFNPSDAQSGPLLYSSGDYITVISRTPYAVLLTCCYSALAFRADSFARYTLLITLLAFLLCAAASIAVILPRALSRRRLAAAMDAAAQGDYTVRVSRGPLCEQFNSMMQAINDNVIQTRRAAQAQKDFVANFSHELKTPLTAIIGYADLMRSAELDGEDAFTAASYIFSEGKRLESLSLKLMDMIVLEKQDFPLRPLPAGKLLQHIAITVRPMLSTAELTLEFHAAAARVEGERDLLTTLVMNLLDNARKASENGGKIILRGIVQGDRYRISIQDFGRGIPPEELSRITEAFYMVDKSRARAQHGAGLGLALAQRIAVLHGSGLEFQSVLGEGTTVSFTLKRIPKQKELQNEETV